MYALREGPSFRTVPLKDTVTLVEDILDRLFSSGGNTDHENRCVIGESNWVSFINELRPHTAMLRAKDLFSHFRTTSIFIRASWLAQQF